MDNLMSADFCTLPTIERPTRLAEFDALFVSSARRVVRDGERVRIHLVGSAGLSDRVRDLTDRETACCSFFTFLIEGDDTDLTLTVSVPPERRDVLTALAERAEELVA
jgi:hypothetical protein